MGHALRINEDRLMKEVVFTKTISRRGEGRPNPNWEKYIEDDLRRVGVRDWKRMAQDTERWKLLVS